MFRLYVFIFDFVLFDDKWGCADRAFPSEGNIKLEYICFVCGPFYFPFSLGYTKIHHRICGIFDEDKKGILADELYLYGFIHNQFKI